MLEDNRERSALTCCKLGEAKPVFKK